jgi:hypothetical protein
MKKAIVITLGVIIGVTGVLAICAHLADAARLALYVPEDEDDEDIYPVLSHWHNPRRLALPPAGTVAWKRPAGAAAKPDTRVGASHKYRVDRQKPACNTRCTVTRTAARSIQCFLTDFRLQPSFRFAPPHL